MLVLVHRRSPCPLSGRSWRVPCRVPCLLFGTPLILIAELETRTANMKTASFPTYGNESPPSRNCCASALGWTQTSCARGYVGDHAGRTMQSWTSLRTLP
eukprot:9468256-Pyramimonas_sp.AAC.1